MLSRGDKGRRFREALANHIEDRSYLFNYGDSMDKYKDKYLELKTEIFENEKIHYIEKDGQKWIPLEILGEMAGFADPHKSAYNLFSRKANNAILSEFSTSINLMVVENGIKRHRDIICLNIEGARLFMMLARTQAADKYKRLFAKLLNYVPEPIALSVKQLPEQLPMAHKVIDLIARLHDENTLIIDGLRQQSEEIQKTKQIAEEAIRRTEYITKNEFFTLFNKVKDLKLKGDKHIWRDFERTFRISNLGQLPAYQYQAALSFLEDREKALFKHQRRLFDKN